MTGRHCWPNRCLRQTAQLLLLRKWYWWACVPPRAGLGSQVLSLERTIQVLLHPALALLLELPRWWLYCPPHAA